MTPPRRLVVVLVKFPEPGRVKSRLAASIGAQAAVAVYRRLVGHTLDALSETDCTVWIYGDPADQLGGIEAWLLGLSESQQLPRGTEYIAQAPGDLGQKLDHVFRRAFSREFRQVIAIGTDCAGIGSGHISAAGLALDRVDAVFGPALDGGYYLIGLRQVAPTLFQNIPWSSPETLSASLRAAADAGLAVHLLESLRDIDTEADLQAEPWLMKDAQDQPAEP
ncbi:MAG: TIGR04282 family arsenosugar biosynthesis glycosyltransferase [Verrucomicrobiales bacterium]